MDSDRRLRRTTRQKKTFRPENKINCAENKSGADPGVPMAFPGFGTRLPPDHRRDSGMTIRVRRRSTRARARDAPPGPGLAPARGRRARPPRNPFRAFSSGQSACACPFRRPHRGASRRPSVFFFLIRSTRSSRRAKSRPAGPPATDSTYIHIIRQTQPTRTTDTQRHEARRILDQLSALPAKANAQTQSQTRPARTKLEGKGTRTAAVSQAGRLDRI